MDDITRQAVSKRAPSPLRVVSIGRVKKRKVAWLWPGRIPLGMLSILEGRKGYGKSTIAAAIAAHVTGGNKLPGCKRRQKGAVIYFSGEEDNGVIIKPRLEAAGADMGKVFVLEANRTTGLAPSLSLPSRLPELEALIRRKKATLVILDPYISFVDASLDMNSEADARWLLEPLAALAARTGCAILVIRHIRKGQCGTALDQGLGSTAIGNVARSILRVDQLGEQTEQFVLASVACNLGPAGPALSYHLEGAGDVARIKWEGEADVTADQLADGRTDAVERGQLRDVARLLREKIGDGWVRSQEVHAEAMKHGISPQKVWKQMVRMKLQTRRVGGREDGHWEMGPPLGGWLPEL